MDAPKVGVLSFLMILQCIYDANFVFVWPSDQTKTWSGEKPFCWLDRDYLELFDENNDNRKKDSLKFK